MVKYIAPVKVYAGEFEMDALAAGALRVLTGQEQPKTYTGVPVWNGFEKIGNAPDGRRAPSNHEDAASTVLLLL